MKKILFIAILLISYGTSCAQVRFGFRVAPTISFNRVQATGDQYNISANGSALKLQLGPTFDFPFRENHFFSTGIYFVTKQTNLAFQDRNTANTTYERSDLQYIQIPITLKLYTEEIGLDKKIYFQFGLAPDIRTQGILGGQDDLLEQVDLFELNALLAAGLEYRFGLNTKLYSGIFYNRGMFNAVRRSNVGQDWRLNMDVIGLELGVNF